MVDAGEGCIGWGARDRDLMRGTVGTHGTSTLDFTVSYLFSIFVGIINASN